MIWLLIVLIIIGLAGMGTIYACLIQLHEMNHKATILLQINEKAGRVELKIREATEDLKTLNHMSEKICKQTRPLYDIVRIRFASEINRSDKLTPPEN